MRISEILLEVLRKRISIFLENNQQTKCFDLLFFDKVLPLREEEIIESLKSSKYHLIDFLLNSDEEIFEETREFLKEKFKKIIGEKSKRKIVFIENFITDYFKLVCELNQKHPENTIFFFREDSKKILFAYNNLYWFLKEKKEKEKMYQDKNLDFGDLQLRTKDIYKEKENFDSVITFGPISLYNNFTAQDLIREKKVENICLPIQIPSNCVTVKEANYIPKNIFLFTGKQVENFLNKTKTKRITGVFLINKYKVTITFILKIREILKEKIFDHTILVGKKELLEELKPFFEIENYNNGITFLNLDTLIHPLALPFENHVFIDLEGKSFASSILLLSEGEIVFINSKNKKLKEILRRKNLTFLLFSDDSELKEKIFQIKQKDERDKILEKIRTRFVFEKKFI